jgi:AcrR family transcriptional regulator
MTAGQDRVLTVAARLYASRGVAGVSMRQLAAELAIQAPSIYSHFPSQAVLIEQVCQPYLDRLDALEHTTRWPATWAQIIREHQSQTRIVHHDPAVQQWGTVGLRARHLDRRFADWLCREDAPRSTAVMIVDLMHSLTVLDGLEWLQPVLLDLIADARKGLAL